MELPALFKPYRRIIRTALVVGAAFLLFAVSLRDVYRGTIVERGIFFFFSPLQRVVAETVRMIERLENDYLFLRNVRRENEILTARLREMVRRESLVHEIVKENERLTKLLGFKSRISAPTVAASVVGEDGYPWFRTVVVDRGTSSGIVEGAPVVAASGVVGQVVRVAPDSSRVLLFTDPASSISGVIQRSRARGVVRGRGGGRAALEFTLREEDVKVGDMVVTSGIGGIFPKGIPIGEVTVVRKGEYGVFQTIEIRPAVDLARLEEVLVFSGPVWKGEER